MAAAYLGYRTARWLSLRLPSRSAFGLAERLADLQWRRSAVDRAAVRSNLALALGALPADDAPVVREVFRHFARYLVEFFRLHAVSDPAVRVDGAEHLRRAAERGRGAIILTAHLGNWEAGAVLIRRMGFPVSVVALPHREPRLNRLFDDQRRRNGLDVIPLGADAIRHCLERLRRGDLLGILGDRIFTKGGGVPVRLGGREVLLPRGPAILSARSGAPLIPSFLLREGRWAFRLCVEPPLSVSGPGDLSTRIRRLTQAYADVLERYLTRYPEQWLVFQPLPETGG
jgi:KDO2-lipid IV(A) lauroyltransferase